MSLSPGESLEGAYSLAIQERESAALASLCVSPAPLVKIVHQTIIATAL